MAATGSEPSAAYTALEGIRVAVSGAPPGDVALTVGAEINDLGAGDAVAVFRHAMEALTFACIMAGASIERVAKAEAREAGDVYDDLRRAYEGFTL